MSPDDSTLSPNLSAQQLVDYNHYGFCQLPDYLNAHELDSLQSICNVLTAEPVEGDDEGSNIHRLGKG